MSQEVKTRQLTFRAETTSDDGRTLRGLAVPFNDPTRIDNPWEGTFDEQFAPGAFKRSIGMRTPKLQFDHGSHPMIGSLPIGEIRNLTETKRGLEVEARLFDAPLFEPLREALRTDAIDGMSIRFRPLRIDIEERGEDDVQLQTITEAELIELGPVIFPAYQGTEVDLRSFDLSNEIDRHRLAEALLGGVSLDRGGRGRTPGPGTSPHEAGEPVEQPDPDSFHSDSVTPQHQLSRARKRRLKLMEIENGPGGTAGAPALTG